MIFDALDGKVARWRNESSMLGQELDSLADSVSFAPLPKGLGNLESWVTELGHVALRFRSVLLLPWLRSALDCEQLPINWH